MPKISINLCCYNGQNYLREALDSVIAQTYKDWDLVFIDDGSTDSTGQIIQEYIDLGFPIACRHQENKGLGYSRNKALELSTGEYIAFIDHDDVWLPEKLEQQMELFRKDRELALVYSDCFNVYPGNRKIPVSKYFRLYRGRVFERLLATNFIVMSTVIARKDVIEEFGGFPNYKICEEYDLFLKIAHKYPINYVPEPLALYLYHEDNSSRNLEITLEEAKGILRYWSVIGNDQVKEMCRRKMGRTYYGLSRRALFHVHDRAKAKALIRESLRYQRRFVYVSFAFLCAVPLKVTLWLRQRLLDVKARRSGF